MTGVSQDDEGLEIRSIGMIYSGPWRKKYFSSCRGKDRIPYPVGYSVIRTFCGHNFYMSIQQGERGPVFVVECEEGMRHTGHSPDVVWIETMKWKHSGALWSHSKRRRMNGLEAFGFQKRVVRNFLQNLLEDSISVEEPSTHQSVSSRFDGAMKETLEEQELWLAGTAAAFEMQNVPAEPDTARQQDMQPLELSPKTNAPLLGCEQHTPSASSYKSDGRRSPFVELSTNTLLAMTKERKPRAKRKFISDGPQASHCQDVPLETTDYAAPLNLYKKARSSRILATEREKEESAKLTRMQIDPTAGAPVMQKPNRKKVQETQTTGCYMGERSFVCPLSRNSSCPTDPATARSNAPLFHVAHRSMKDILCDAMARSDDVATPHQRKRAKQSPEFGTDKSFGRSVVYGNIAERANGEDISIERSNVLDSTAAKPAVSSRVVGVSMGPYGACVDSITPGQVEDAGDAYSLAFLTAWSDSQAGDCTGNSDWEMKPSVPSFRPGTSDFTAEGDCYRTPCRQHEQDAEDEENEELDKWESRRIGSGATSRNRPKGSRRLEKFQVLSPSAIGNEHTEGAGPFGGRIAIASLEFERTLPQRTVLRRLENFRRETGLTAKCSSQAMVWRMLTAALTDESIRRKGVIVKTEMTHDFESDSNAFKTDSVSRNSPWKQRPKHGGARSHKQAGKTEIYHTSKKLSGFDVPKGQISYTDPLVYKNIYQDSYRQLDLVCKQEEVKEIDRKTDSSKSEYMADQQHPHLFESSHIQCRLESLDPRTESASGKQKLELNVAWKNAGRLNGPVGVNHLDGKQETELFSPAEIGDLAFRSSKQEIGIAEQVTSARQLDDLFWRKKRRRSDSRNLFGVVRVELPNSEGDKKVIQINRSAETGVNVIRNPERQVFGYPTDGLQEFCEQDTAGNVYLKAPDGRENFNELLRRSPFGELLDTKMAREPNVEDEETDDPCAFSDAVMHPVHSEGVLEERKMRAQLQEVYKEKMEKAQVSEANSKQDLRSLDGEIIGKSCRSQGQDHQSEQEAVVNDVRKEKQILPPILDVACGHESEENDTFISNPAAAIAKLEPKTESSEDIDSPTAQRRPCRNAVGEDSETESPSNDIVEATQWPPSPSEERISSEPFERRSLREAFAGDKEARTSGFAMRLKIDVLEENLGLSVKNTSFGNLKRVDSPIVADPSLPELEELQAPNSERAENSPTASKVESPTATESPCPRGSSGEISIHSAEIRAAESLLDLCGLPGDTVDPAAKEKSIFSSMHSHSNCKSEVPNHDAHLPNFDPAHPLLASNGITSSDRERSSQCNLSSPQAATANFTEPWHIVDNRVTARSTLKLEDSQFPASCSPFQSPMPTRTNSELKSRRAAYTPLVLSPSPARYEEDETCPPFRSPMKSRNAVYAPLVLGTSTAGHEDQEKSAAEGNGFENLRQQEARQSSSLPNVEVSSGHMLLTQSVSTTVMPPLADNLAVAELLNLQLVPQSSIHSVSEAPFSSQDNQGRCPILRAQAFSVAQSESLGPDKAVASMAEASERSSPHRSTSKDNQTVAGKSSILCVVETKESLPRWDSKLLKNLEPALGLKHPLPVLSVHVNKNDGNIRLSVCCGEPKQLDREVFVYRVSSNKELRPLQDEGNSTIQYSCNLEASLRLALKEYDTDSEDRENGMAGSSGLAFLPTGDRLLTIHSIVLPQQSNDFQQRATDKNAISIVDWSPNSEQAIARLEVDVRLRCLLTPSPTTLLAGGDGGALVCWQMEENWTRSRRRYMLPSAHYHGIPFDRIISLSAVPGRPTHIVGAAYRGSLAIWDIEKGLLISTCHNRFSLLSSVHVLEPLTTSEAKLRTAERKPSSPTPLVEGQKNIFPQNGGDEVEDVFTQPMALMVMASSRATAPLHENQFQLPLTEKSNGIQPEFTCCPSWLHRNTLIIGGPVDQRMTAFAGMGRIGAAGTKDGYLYVWDVWTGKKITQLSDLKGSQVTCVAAYEASGLLAVAAMDGTLVLYSYHQDRRL